jgi:two-component system chemotaxis response regulator CheB
MANEIRVLIVDDSAFARLAISRELKSAGGIEVVDYARNGLEALAKIKQLKPDVVTLDV